MADTAYDIIEAPKAELAGSKGTFEDEEDFPRATFAIEPVSTTGAPTGDWNEPVQRADPLPFLNEEPVPTEAEKNDALVKLKPYSGMPKEEIARYTKKLTDYYQNEKNAAIAKKKEAAMDLYRSPNGLLEVTKNPAVRREMDSAIDDDLVAKRAMNRNFLAEMYDEPNATPERLDTLMREHSIKHWGINNPSHETFYTKTQGEVVKFDKETKVLDTAKKTIVTDILKEQPGQPRLSSTERAAKLSEANPDVIDTPEKRDRLAQHMWLIEDRVRTLKDSVRFPASQLIDLANKVKAGTVTEIDYERATNSIRGVPEADLRQVFKLGALVYRDEDPKGEMLATIATNIGKRFDRDFNLTKVYERTREALLNSQMEELKAGASVGKDANGRLAFARPGQPLPPNTVPVSPDEYKTYWNDVQRGLDGMALARVITSFREEVADPVTPFFEGGLLGAAEAGVYDIAGFSKLLPLFAAGAINPVVGVAGASMAFGLMSASTYHRLRTDNPTLPIQAAQDWANVDGLINTVGMKFKADFLLGHYPFIQTARTLTGAGKSWEAMMVYGRWAAVHNIEENAEELAQDTLSAVVEKLYGDAYPTHVKQKEWSDMWKEIAMTRPQVAMAVGPLSLVGAGFATVNDMRNPMRDFMNRDALKMQGLSDEKVEEILATGNLEDAEKVFRKHMAARTAADVKAGFDYATSLVEEDETNPAMADPALPKLEPTIEPDGTYKYTLFDETGKPLATFTDPDAAETAWIRETERVQDEIKARDKESANQQAAQEAAAAASDEGVAKEAEAKATAETVSPEDRLGTATSVDFEQNVTATPEESSAVAGLQADVQAAGRADVIVLARPSDAQTGPGAATLNFVRAFEAATGKRVVFVASGSDQPLSFTGAVRAGDPNTIFLDAHGDRNILALVGHEWSHTLEKTSPELHAEMIGRMKPLVVDWAKQEGILAQEVDAANVTNEMVANIVGDAISNEEFWYSLAYKNPGLFIRVRNAVIQFFNQFIGKVQKSEFGTEVFIKDAVQMRDIVADIMDRAGQGAEAATAAAGVSFAPRAVPSDKEITAALSSDKQPHVGAHRGLAAGTPVGVRIDIPAYERHGTYVQTIHEPKTGGQVGKRIGYDSIVRLKEPKFFSNEKGALKIYKGESAKFPVATVEGKYSPARNLPKDIDAWTPVGYNPRQHSYFYDKTNGELVLSGDEAVSVGNTVFVKNPVYGDKSQAMFAPRRGGQKMAGAKGEREVAGKGYIEKAEIAQIAVDAAKIMETADPKMVKAAGGAEKMLAEIKRQVRTDVLAQRIKFPDATVPGVKDPWAPIVYKGIVFEARETAPGFKAVAGWEKEPYSYEEPPEGVSREEWVQTLAKRSTQQFIERLQKGFGKGASEKAQKNAQTILDSIEWYRDFVELVRGEWGGFSDLMADFLGAFSPNQNVRQNWRNAVDAINGLSHGKYDQLFTELDAWIKSGKTIKDWRAANKPLMRSKSGALFGTNTELGHQAALDMWRAIKAGDAPKAKNFTRNLIGLSIRATIDLWAARLLQRVAEKPRVAGVAKMGIKGKHVQPKKGQEGMPIEESVSGQFKFGQDVMAVVADQMRDPKTWEGTDIDGSLFKYVTAADVQAMNWFVEKEIWWDNGWTNEEGSGGSMIYELNQERSSRYVVGLSQEISWREGTTNYIPQNADQAAFTRDIWDSLRKKYPDALAIRVMDSIGSFMGSVERSTDIEMVHPPGMDPDEMMKEILYQAYAKDQSSVFISRVMHDWEDDEDGNARPGLEFFFNERVTQAQMQPVLDFLRSRGIDGFTLIVDRRTTTTPEGGPNEFWGARLQYIPELSGDENWQQKAIEYREAMKIVGRLVGNMPGVAYVGVVRYDTIVLQKGMHYDDSGIYPGALSGSESRAWRRRSVDATAEASTRGQDQEQGAIDSEPLPSGEPGQGRGGRAPPASQPGAREVEVTAYDRKAKAFVRKTMAPSSDLLQDLKREHKLYERLLKCLS